jgi:hypothetical protein
VPFGDFDDQYLMTTIDLAHRSHNNAALRHFAGILRLTALAGSKIYAV